MLFEGREITNLPEYRIADLGIARTFQVFSLFPKLTVWENLLVAYPDQKGESLRAVFTRYGSIHAQKQEQMERANRSMERIGLTQKMEERAANLQRARGADA